MSPLRVLYSFPFRAGVPGIGNTAWQQANAVAATGAEVRLVVGSLERPMPEVASLTQTLKLGRVKVPIGVLGINRAAAAHDAITARLLAARRWPVDAVHCWPLGSRRTLRAARKLGIPTFLERPNTHTAFAYEAVAEEYRLLGIPQPPDLTHAFDAEHLRIEELEYSLADYLLCPSDFVASTFRNRGFPAEKLLATQYGYDPQLFHPGGAPHDGGLRLLFAGSAEPRKGLHYALQAWAESRASSDGELQIAGAISPGYEQVIDRWLGTAGVAALGYRNDIPDLLRGCDALVLPSIEEGSALVTYEAMASGATLLVSDATGAHARHAVEALIHPRRDVPALVAHMDALASDHKLRIRLRSAATARAASLTWADAGTRLCELYGSFKERA